MSSYREHYSISSHDVFANNSVRPSIITRLFQETANHQMRDRGPTYMELFSQGKSYILVRMSCQITGRLGIYDDVDVDTWISESRGATFKRNYKMSRDGEEIARAYSEWTVVNIEDGAILRVTDVDYSNYDKDEPIEMIIPIKFHIPKDVDFKLVGEKEIAYSDCDMNLHMNNTNYHDMLFNHIPDNQNKEVSGYTIRFMRGATLGKTIEIYRARRPEVLRDGAGGEESWLFKTLIEGDINIEAVVNCRILKN